MRTVVKYALLVWFLDFNSSTSASLPPYRSNNGKLVNLKNLRKREAKTHQVSGFSPNLISSGADDLVVRENKVRKRSAEPQDDYYEKGDSVGGGGGESGDYFEHKDWSDLFRSANPSSNATVKLLKNSELYDIDGVFIRPVDINNSLKNESKEKTTSQPTKRNNKDKKTPRKKAADNV